MPEGALIDLQHLSGGSRLQPRRFKSGYQSALEFDYAPRVVSAGSGNN
jgi:hypothetical protein